MDQVDPLDITQYVNDYLRKRSTPAGNGELPVTGCGAGSDSVTGGGNPSSVPITVEQSPGNQTNSGSAGGGFGDVSGDGSGSIKPIAAEQNPGNQTNSGSVGGGSVDGSGDGFGDGSTVSISIKQNPDNQTSSASADVGSDGGGLFVFNESHIQNLSNETGSNSASGDGVSTRSAFYETNVGSPNSDIGGSSVDTISFEGRRRQKGLIMVTRHHRHHHSQRSVVYSESECPYHMNSSQEDPSRLPSQRYKAHLIESRVTCAEPKRCEPVHRKMYLLKSTSKCIRGERQWQLMWDDVVVSYSCSLPRVADTKEKPSPPP